MHTGKGSLREHTQGVVFLQIGIHFVRYFHVTSSRQRKSINELSVTSSRTSLSPRLTRTHIGALQPDPCPPDLQFWIAL